VVRQQRLALSTFFFSFCWVATEWDLISRLELHDLVLFDQQVAAERVNDVTNLHKMFFLIWTDCEGFEGLGTREALLKGKTQYN
jgi:hypothetical protein